MVMRRAPLDRAKRLAMLLLAERGAQQADIAKRFGVTQSTVSRVVTLAESTGELRRNLVVNREKFDLELLKSAEQSASEPPAVQEKLTRLATGAGDAHPVAVHVLPVAQSGRPAGDLDERTLHFGHEAARPVLEMLQSGTWVCGVTWGHSIGAVVRGIAALSQPTARAGALEIVPLCGDPLGQDAASLYSSSALAQQLRDALGLRAGGHSLAMLPAFLPGDFSAKEVDTVWKLIGKMHAYAEIFGGRESRQTSAGSGTPSSSHYAARLDLILTGISAAGSPLGDGRGPLFESRALREATFKDLVLADIGGVLIEKGRLRTGQKATLSRLKARWTGLNDSELRACAARAAKPSGGTRPPGVVVVAIGKRKAEPILAAVERRLVNQLLVDAELAEELLLRSH